MTNGSVKIFSMTIRNELHDNKENLLTKRCKKCTIQKKERNKNEQKRR